MAGSSTIEDLGVVLVSLAGCGDREEVAHALSVLSAEEQGSLASHVYDACFGDPKEQQACGQPMSEELWQEIGMPSWDEKRAELQTIYAGWSEIAQGDGKL